MQNLHSETLLSIVRKYTDGNWTPLELGLGFIRYKKLKQLNPRQFAELHSQNLKGKRFDDLVDRMIVDDSQIVSTT